ncbi:hypothetical protein [Alicyclobacillus fastidiosus]|uniref:Glycosyltransferase RgtA/B/C/D-like domain-containing protein n=1 Tax=Alicyclobacillus fastidiosus TaxID=392011 RepID=A0ABV5AC07_9BACL|nr:hypothetical protein [Alicyclobacillus fastidiosus]WEH11487.1 hypothetical protein PYS47_09875 [Alicyclobacillus fastidiosus]
MYNTSVVAISVLFGWLVPMTSTVFVYNFVFFINIFLIGCVGRAILRECGIRTWLSTWGGIMFCIMPYLTAQELGHMSQYFVSPLFVATYLFVRCINGKANHQMIYGTAIGVVCAAEFYTSLELTVTFLLVLSIFLIYLGIQKSGRTWIQIHFGPLPGRFWIPLVLSAGILMLPGIFAFISTGGLLFSGVEMHPNSGGYWVADFLSPWYPTRLSLIHTALTQRITNGDFLGTPEEHGNYVGIFFFCSALILCRAWRTPVSRSLSWLAITMFILSLGTHVHVFGRQLPIVLPWILFSRVPFLNSALPIRLALYVDASLVIWTTMSLQHYLSSVGSVSIRRLIWLTFICFLPLVSWLPTIDYPYSSVYSLPKAIVQRIGSQPVFWITPNFGYDMQALTASRYELKVYNMYGFSPSDALNQAAGASLSQFQFSAQYGSSALWVQQIRTIKQTLHSGYVLLTPFDPSGVPLPSSLKQEMTNSFGKPVLQIKGCDLWAIRNKE